MAKRQIDRLREKFVNKFFIRQLAPRHYIVAYVMGVVYYKKNSYGAIYMSIHVQEDFGQITVTKRQNCLLEHIIDNYEPRGKKWAEGFMEKMIEELKGFGEGQIDV